MENNDLVGLIPAAGRGIRISSYSKNINKTLLRIEGKPIIKNIIDIMRDALHIKQIYVLVGYRKEDVIGQLKDGKELGVRIQYIEIADVAKGLAQGIAEAEKYIHGDFCVILGDEVYYHSNHDELIQARNKDYDAVCAVKEVPHPNQIKKNYSVEIQDGKIVSLVEKPTVIKNNYLGCGTYLFRKSLFDHIRATPPSKKTKRIELTEVINRIAEKGGRVYPFFLNGGYVNINNADDYVSANYEMRSLHFHEKTISLIIPAYNEESSIGYVIDDFKDKVNEILVVNNNSADKTEKIARSKGARVLTGSFKGYGDALKAGMNNATGDILVLVEADGSFFSRDLGKILEYLKDADMVLGTRTTKQMIEQAANMDFILRWGNICAAKVIEILWLFKNEPRLTDVGCTFRGIWKSAYEEMKDSLQGMGPEFSPEMIVEAIRHNKRSIEIPITYSGRIGGESKFSRNILSNAKTAVKMFKLIFRKKYFDVIGKRT